MRSKSEAIAHYLGSGDYDLDHPQWPGQNIMERSIVGHDEHVEALIAKVKERAAGCVHARVPDIDLTSWTRRKLAPMVNGLFPAVERDRVLAMLETSVVFLTSDNIEAELRGQHWLRSAWSLANLYLGSVGAELLGPDAPSLLGLSQGTTCYVTAEYFVERGRIEDFVIHEAAHVFHNCKRRNLGLPHTRTKEWLLHLEFAERERFAYSCEAFGWIVERASSRAERLALGERFAANGFGDGETSVDPEDVADIVQEACAARNGWKVILRRCAPQRRAAARALASIVAVEPTHV